LADGQRGEEDGDEAILSPWQAVIEMSGDLEYKLSIPALMDKRPRRWWPDGQPAENERAGGEAKVIALRLPR
jgi:hypothetical protein